MTKCAFLFCQSIGTFSQLLLFVKIRAILISGFVIVLISDTMCAVKVRKGLCTTLKSCGCA